MGTQDKKLGYTSIGIERIVNKYITSKERYNQIIDEANTNYLRNCLDTKWMKEDFYFDGSPRHHLYLREEFINKCKTDPEFSEKWGLKIEERELSLEERKKLYEGEFTPGIEVTNDHWLNSKLITRNIPTKLITLTYNNETIESYE